MKAKRLVLVVDDSEIDRKLLLRVLSAEYTVLNAADGAAALKLLKLRGGEVSAVLLDLVMPVMDGYEFLTRVRAIAQFAALPVIVMTQADSEDVHLRALALGATDFLPKPYRPAIILQRLANLVGFYEASSQRNALERDELTGLYSRVAFFGRMAQRQEEEQALAHELAVVDIDRFKLVNELFGLAAGDELLRFTAGLIAAEAAGCGALCARFAGDDFVLYGRFAAGWAEDFAHRLQTGLSGYSLPLVLTVRVGVYTAAPADELTPGAMYDRARIALAAIKGKYDRSCGRYSRTDTQRLLEAQQIEGDMRGALTRDEFEMYFQPKYDLTTGQVDGAEALLRWNHPQRGRLGPDAFIPLFEQNGFISALDEWLWRRVCQWLAHRAETDSLVVPISVNVSRVDLYNPGLPALLKGLLEEYQIRPGLLELEITETAYTESPDQLIRVVHQLKALGLVVQMDDFGSGYSSLNMLAEVPVDVLKLDMRFLQSTADHSRNVLNFVIALAKWMNLSVVAEGIETREQAAFLRSMGCNHGQGYYFSKPMPQTEFERLLDQNIVRDVGGGETMFSGMIDVAEIWNPASSFNLLFNGYVGALAIFEYIPDSLFLVRGNENFYRMEGNARDEIYRKGANEMDGVYPDDRPALRQSLAALLAGEDETGGDLRRICADGGLLWLHLRARVIYREAGRILLLISLENCTESKLLAQKLERQRHFLKNIYDTVPCGIAQFELAEGYPFLSANTDMLAMLGLSRAAFEARRYSLTEFVDRVGRSHLADSLVQLAQCESGHLSRMEYQLHSKTGGVIWISDITQLIPGENGGLICQTVFTDITEKKKKEQELRLIQQQFCIAVSHANNWIFTYFPESGRVQLFETGGKGRLSLRMIERGIDFFLKKDDLLAESRSAIDGFFREID